MRFFLISALMCLALAGCGGGHNPDKAFLEQVRSVGRSSYFDLGGGRGRMVDSLDAVASGANFEISFELEDGGEMSLYTFADVQLQNGIEVRFRREGHTLKVTGFAQGSSQEWSPRFASIDASQTITFTMDIHNSERPAHILVWSGGKNPALNHRNTIYNSAEDSIDLNYDNSPGNGFGRAWGFRTQNAKLINAVLSSPQDNH